MVKAFEPISFLTEENEELIAILSKSIDTAQKNKNLKK
jgi:hypothetical protein